MGLPILYHVLLEDLIKNISKLSNLYHEILNSEITLNQCKLVANYLNNYESCFILGKNSSYYIAMEGALKIKEIGYIHAEAYPGGSLKHGPFALIDPGIPIILLVMNDHDRSYMESTVNEVKSRKAYTIIITDIADYNEGDVNIHIPSNDILTSLLAVIPLQLIAYNLGIVRGISVDTPKHLAKCVSVI